MKKLCGKPADLFGALEVKPYWGMSGVPARPVPTNLDLHNDPFCRSCTKAPTGWHRSFVSYRPALQGETCAAPL